MADRGSKGQAFPLMIDRFEYKNIWQMHAAIEWVIQNKYVTGFHVITEMAEDRFQRRWNRT